MVLEPVLEKVNALQRERPVLRRLGDGSRVQRGSGFEIFFGCCTPGLIDERRRLWFRYRGWPKQVGQFLIQGTGLVSLRCVIRDSSENYPCL